jgi:hypothetical protein
MMTDIEKMVIIDNFINMLHKGEYIIDPKARDIPYGDESTLADFIDQALQGYTNALAISLSPHPSAIIPAYNAITAANTHSVVIEKGDLRRIVRETEERLKLCEEDKARLEKDNNDLHRELINCQQLKQVLQEQLLSYSQTDRGDEKYD